jgi:hypothetical protein
MCKTKQESIQRWLVPRHAALPGGASTQGFEPHHLILQTGQPGWGDGGGGHTWRLALQVFERVPVTELAIP